MQAAQFWSNLTSFAAFLGDDRATGDRTLGELEKEIRNAAPEHRLRISHEIATIVAKLTDLKMRTAQAIPPTLVSGDTAHMAENV